METRDLRELVEFSEQAPMHRAVFESEQLWSELLCLDRAHRYGPISDPRSDGIFTVVAGEVSIQVGAKRKRLRQWGAAFAPAGQEVTVVNASPEPAVVLIVTAPPPARTA